MIIYIVGHRGPEHDNYYSVHRTYNGALIKWNQIRENLLNKAKKSQKNNKLADEMWQRIIKNLNCKDPNKIDNYPHETPYIQEMKLID